MNTGTIYYNTAEDKNPHDGIQTGIDFSEPNELIGTAGHENIHAAGEQSESIADRGYEQAQNAWQSENRYNGNTEGGGYESKQEFTAMNRANADVARGSGRAEQVDAAAALLNVPGP